MKGLLDYLMGLTGTGPYAVEAVKARAAGEQRPTSELKGARLPVSQSAARVPKGRRLLDYLEQGKPGRMAPASGMASPPKKKRLMRLEDAAEVFGEGSGRRSEDISDRRRAKRKGYMF